MVRLAAPQAEPILTFDACAQFMHPLADCTPVPRKLFLSPACPPGPYCCTVCAMNNRRALPLSFLAALGSNDLRPSQIPPFRQFQRDELVELSKHCMGISSHQSCVPMPYMLPPNLSSPLIYLIIFFNEKPDSLPHQATGWRQRQGCFYFAGGPNKTALLHIKRPSCTGQALF